MITPEQLVLRKTGIGGSDAAAVVGLSHYATPFSVYLDKTTDAVKETTEVMNRGHVLEPFVQSLFERKTGWKVQNTLQTQRSPDHPFMLANLDGVLPSERAVVEFKTALYTPKVREEWGEEGTDEIPKHYLIQVAHYACVMDVDTAYIGVLFGDEKIFNAYRKIHALAAQTKRPLSRDDLDELHCDFRVYVYKRHGELTRKLINREQSFWFDHVLVKKPPLPQNGDVEDILKAYPRATERVVCVGDEEESEIQAFRQIKCQIKELEKQEESMKAQILRLFGDASVLVDRSHTPLETWKNKSLTRFDKTGFAKEHPALCDAFTKTTSTRELRLI